MIISEKIIVFALEHKEFNTFAVLMNALMAEYIEGFEDSAGTSFNRIWKITPAEAKQYVIDTCVFESIANDLAKKNNLIAPYEKVGEYEWKFVREGKKDPRQYTESPQL